MEAVNLLPGLRAPRASAGPPSARTSLRVASLTPAGVAACVIALGLGLGYLHERSVVNDRRATLAEVQAQVAVADAKAAPLRAAQAAAAARMAAAGTVSANRVAWERLLADLSRVLPSQVYLQSLSLQSPTPLAPGHDDRRRPFRPSARRASRRRVSRPRTCGSRSSSTGSRACRGSRT